MNKLAMQLVARIIDDRNRLGIAVLEGAGGATVIDMGVNVEGSFEAGLLLTEISMGGLGSATLHVNTYGNLSLPIVIVQTSWPKEALLGSQFAGWKIAVDEYAAIASGPGRALALKPSTLYRDLDYYEKADCAVLVLESSALPSSSTITFLAHHCHVAPSRLSILVAATSSIAGSVQIAGRIAETGMHRLTTLGTPATVFRHAVGRAPIAPPHPDPTIAMGRTNDLLTYGGEAFYIVDCDSNLVNTVITAASSLASKEYGRPFHAIFKAAGYDFYKIDPATFAPAIVSVANRRDGTTSSSGYINTSLIKQAVNYID